MKIRLQTVDTVLDEVEAVRRRVAERAVEIFRQRRTAIGDAIDDGSRPSTETGCCV
jgi:hypothetical protein